MDAFSERRLEAAIVDVLVQVDPGHWVESRTVALSLATQGYGPLETLDRHVLPMLELLELSGRVEHMAAIGPSRRSTCWRLVRVPLVTSAEPPTAALAPVTSP